MICSCCGKHKKPVGLEDMGTALKPAMELIAVARKPLSESTIAKNILRWGTGAINVGACRIEGDERKTQTGGMGRKANPVYGAFANADTEALTTIEGRWPANLCHDGSDEVLAAFPETKSNPGTLRTNVAKGSIGMLVERPSGTVLSTGDSGSAARFFYSAKASRADRALSKHPTVKPVKLMQWLVRLITPPKVMYCPICENNSYGKSIEESGSAEGMRTLRSGVSSSGQSTYGEILQPSVCGSGAWSQADTVRVVRGDVPASEGRGEKVLQQAMLEPRSGQEQVVDTRIRDDEDGLQNVSHAEASTVSCSSGLHFRASMDRGAENWQDADQGGSRPPHQRNQGRQSLGESSTDVEGGSRQNKPSSPEHANVPSLQRENDYKPSCPNCGHGLESRPGRTLDPFAGSGTTGEAAWREGFSAVLIEREEEYQADIERRMLFARARPKEEPVRKPKRDCDPGTLDMFPLESFVASQATNGVDA